MLDNQAEVKKLVSALIQFFSKSKNSSLVSILSKAVPFTNASDYNDWNGGQTGYDLILEIDVDLYMLIRPMISEYEEKIRETIFDFLRGNVNEYIRAVTICPMLKHYLNWDGLLGVADRSRVLDIIQKLENLLISVSTNGPKIETVNEDYMKNYDVLNEWLSALGLDNPNKFRSLWEWYGRYKQGDLPHYSDRSKFIKDLYAPLVETIKESSGIIYTDEFVPTGWNRVDRTIYEMKRRISEAHTEEQFQTIGLLGREVITTIAQQVYNPDRHKSQDEVEISKTDAIRMLKAYIGTELPGSSNEELRKYAKSTLDLANRLTHDRTADMRDASLCVISVVALINIIKVINESMIIDY